MVWLDAEDQTCEVGAGTAPATLDAELAGHGLMLAVDAPCAAEGTLGGVFLAPDLSLLHGAYGPPRDQVLGGTWMLADGSVVRTGARVVKSVAGYDLTRLFLGSGGFLAAALSLVLRLQPRPRCLSTSRVRNVATLRAAALPDPLWHFQESNGNAWAAWDGHTPQLSVLEPVSKEEFHEARLRALAQFAELPRRFAHAFAPTDDPAGPMDWSALQEGRSSAGFAPAEAITIPTCARPPWLDALTEACAPGALPFAADEETA